MAKAAKANKKPAPSQAPGTKQPTGKSDKPVAPDWDGWPKVLQSLATIGFDQAYLKADLEAEQKKVAAAKGYGSFKPMCLYLDEAFKKLLLSINYKAGKPFTPQFHPGELMEACGIFVEGLSQKDPHFVSLLLADVSRVLSGKIKSGKHLSERETAVREAWVTLLVQTLKAYVIGQQLVRAFSDDPEDKTDVREKPSREEAVKGLFEALEKLVVALFTIAAHAKDDPGLREWFKKMKSEELDLLKARERIGERWDALRKVEPAKAAEEKKKRREEFDAFKKKGGTAARIAEHGELVKNVGALISSVFGVWDAWREMHPKDLEGKRWLLAAEWNPGQDFSLVVEKKGANAFEGTLTARGLAVPPDRAGHAAEIIEEKKATCEITRSGPLADKLKFVWKPAGPEAKKLPTAGDVFFTGTKEAEEEVHFESTLRLGEALKLPVAGGAKLAPSVLQREVKIEDWVKVGLAGLKVLGGIWGVVPRRLRAKVSEDGLEFLNHHFGGLVKRVAPLSKWVVLSLDKKETRWILTAGLKSDRATGTVSWDFARLVDAACAALHGEGEGEAKTESSGLAPLAVKVSGALEKVRFTLSMEHPEKKEENKSDTLDELSRWPAIGPPLARLKEFLRDHEGTFAVGRPKVSSGSAEGGNLELPAIELPFVLTLGHFLSAKYPATFTLTVGLTAAQVASAIPAVRACLIAWDVGWAIGTLINELPITQEVMEHVGNWYVSWATAEAWSKDYEEQDKWVLGLQKQRLLTHGDTIVAFIKSPYLAANRYRVEHKLASKFHAVVPDYARAREFRRHWAQEIAAAERDPAKLGHEVRSLGHAYVIAHLLGDEHFHAARVAKKLDEDTRVHLMPIEADFLRFYLYPADYAAMQQSFLRKHQAQHDVVAPRYVAGKLVEPESVAFERLFRFVRGDQHRKLVDLMTCSFPEVGEDSAEILKLHDRWSWAVVRMRANERIAIELVGNGMMAKPLLDAAHHEKALLTACDVRFRSGDFGFAKEALLAHRNQREKRPQGGGEAHGTYARLRVIGEDGSAKDTEQAWFLEVDDSGEVVSAWPS